MRFAALAQILVLFGFAFIVLVRVGLIFSAFSAVGRVGIWLVMVFLCWGQSLT